MKEFAKLAMVLLLALSIVVVATGCDNASKSESVLYRSSVGAQISGTKPEEYKRFAVRIELKEPSRSGKPLQVS